MLSKFMPGDDNSQGVNARNSPFLYTSPLPFK